MKSLESLEQAGKLNTSLNMGSKRAGKRGSRMVM